MGSNVLIVLRNSSAAKGDVQRMKSVKNFLMIFSPIIDSAVDSSRSAWNGRCSLLSAGSP